MEKTEQVTVLLNAASAGDQEAPGKLLEVVYDDLRRLASSYLKNESNAQTLQATALVHEAYLRLVDWKNVSWESRAQFFAIAAQMMRRILVDYARRRRYAKRNGEAHKVPLDEAALMTDERAAELTALDEALVSLAAIDPQQARVVELRFFGGLTVVETAEVLRLSPDMVKREWSTAKAWLSREMGGSVGDER